MSSMKLCILGSGSEGNSTLVYTDSTALLIDAGFTARTVEKRLEMVGFDPGRLSAILLTHEHTDHMRGVEVLSRRYGLSVYVTEGTAERLPLKVRERGSINVIVPEENFMVGNIEVNPFRVPHDGAEPVAFMLENGGRRAVSITDAGFVTVRIVEKIRRAHLALVESNHDSELLKIGPYPWHLKERIAGREGHLSNDECAELLNHAGWNGLSSVILSHLSKKNNHPDLVRIYAENLFRDTNVKYEIASQDRPGSIFEV